jgi:hypothetical protein
MRTVSRLAGVIVCMAALAGCDVVHVAAQSERARGGFSRTLTVKGPVDLSVRTGSGDIQIRTGAADRVEIVARVSAGRSWDADVADPAERVRRVEAAPPIVQEGNVIRIGETQGDRLYNNVSISYDLVVPANSQISAKTGSGDQMIGSVDGAVRAQTGSGDIRIERSGGSLDAQTGSGNVSAASVGGAVRVQTGSGDVQVSQIVRGDVHVRTGSGDVVLNLPADAAYSLDASTGSGGISTAQPITVQGRLRRNHIQGTVRGGGNQVQVKTGSGSIEIR